MGQGMTGIPPTDTHFKNALLSAPRRASSALGAGPVQELQPMNHGGLMDLEGVYHTSGNTIQRSNSTNWKSTVIHRCNCSKCLRKTDTVSRTAEAWRSSDLPWSTYPTVASNSTPSPVEKYHANPVQTWIIWLAPWSILFDDQYPHKRVASLPFILLLSVLCAEIHKYQHIGVSENHGYPTEYHSLFPIKNNSTQHYRTVCRGMPIPD